MQKVLTIYLMGLAVGSSILFSLPTVASEWTHELDFEYRYFLNDSQFAEQADSNRSVVYRPVWSHVSESGNSIYDFRGYARYDKDDEERSHVDINELAWTYSTGNWEIKSGISKVYWGVAEAVHLVDIVNQTDLVDSDDGETKLGQPMLATSYYSEIGTLQAYLLPYFRERTYPGVNGRLRTPIPVDTDAAVYQSKDEENHIDYALRWSHTFGVFDAGISFFDGTGREPVLTANSDGSALIPNYIQIQQVGIDIQATLETWLLKFEAIDRQADAEYAAQDFQSLITGFEYTFFDVAESGADIGLIGEYLYDSRDDLGDLSSFGFVGLRLALNDEQSTDFLVGCAVNGAICAIEGSRRIGENYKLSLRGSAFSGIDDDSVLASQREDDYIQLNLQYYF